MTECRLYGKMVLLTIGNFQKMIRVIREIKMSVVFREFSPADKSFYISSSKVFYNPPYVVHSVPEQHFEKTFQLCIDKSPFIKGFIIEWNNEMAGYVLAAVAYSNEAGGMCLWIEEIYILPVYRGKGIAKKLFELIETKWVPENDYKRVRLEVTGDNKNAIALYKQMGFKQLDYKQMSKDYFA